MPAAGSAAGAGAGAGAIQVSTWFPSTKPVMVEPDTVALSVRNAPEVIGTEAPATRDTAYRFAGYATQRRVPKDSALWYRDLVTTGVILDVTSGPAVRSPSKRPENVPGGQECQAAPEALKPRRKVGK